MFLNQKWQDVSIEEKEKRQENNTFEENVYIIDNNRTILKEIVPGKKNNFLQPSKYEASVELTAWLFKELNSIENNNIAFIDNKIETRKSGKDGIVIDSETGNTIFIDTEIRHKWLENGKWYFKDKIGQKEVKIKASKFFNCKDMLGIQIAHDKSCFVVSLASSHARNELIKISRFVEKTQRNEDEEIRDTEKFLLFKTNPQDYLRFKKLMKKYLDGNFIQELMYDEEQIYKLIK